MLDGLDLEGKRALVVFYIIEFHGEKSDLPLKPLDLFDILATSSHHFDLDGDTVLLLFDISEQFFDASGVGLPELQPDIVQDKYEDLDVALLEGPEQEPYQVVEERVRHRLEQEQVHVHVHQVLHPVVVLFVVLLEVTVELHQYQAQEVVSKAAQ